MYQQFGQAYPSFNPYQPQNDQLYRDGYGHQQAYQPRPKPGRRSLGGGLTWEEQAMTSSWLAPEDPRTIERQPAYSDWTQETQSKWQPQENPRNQDVERHPLEPVTFSDCEDDDNGFGNFTPLNFSNQQSRTGGYQQNDAAMQADRPISRYSFADRRRSAPMQWQVVEEIDDLFPLDVPLPKWSMEPSVEDEALQKEIRCVSPGSLRGRNPYVAWGDLVPHPSERTRMQQEQTMNQRQYEPTGYQTGDTITAPRNTPNVVQCSPTRLYNRKTRRSEPLGYTRI